MELDWVFDLGVQSHLKSFNVVFLSYLKDCRSFFLEEVNCAGFFCSSKHVARPGHCPLGQIRYVKVEAFPTQRSFQISWLLIRWPKCDHLILISTLKKKRVKRGHYISSRINIQRLRTFYGACILIFEIYSIFSGIKSSQYISNQSLHIMRAWKLVHRKVKP